MPDPTTITPDPDRDGVLIHIPEIAYLDTQPGAVDIGLSTSSLAALRAAFDDLTSGQLDRERESYRRLALRLDVAIGRAEDAEAAIARVRALHTPIQHLGRAWCDACSVRRRTGLKTDDEWVAFIPYPCPTLEELDGIAPEPAATGATEPHTGLVIQPYRNDRHEHVWVFRCWGTSACDGHLSLDHHTQESAERARDRHLAENHAEQTSEVQRLSAELAALRQVARGYCPACGRGDAAPTTADWEQQKQRADEAETRLHHLGVSSKAAGILLARTTDERDQLAGLIREILDQFADWPTGGFPWPQGGVVARVDTTEWDRWDAAHTKLTASKEN